MPLVVWHGMNLAAKPFGPIQPAVHLWRQPSLDVGEQKRTVGLQLFQCNLSRHPNGETPCSTGALLQRGCIVQSFECTAVSLWHCLPV